MIVMRTWVFAGQLMDLNRELFVASANEGGLAHDMWRDGYWLDQNQLPPFLTQTLANKILRAGKSINFLQECCGDVKWVQDRAAAAQSVSGSTISFGNVETLERLVQDASSEVDPHLIVLIARGIRVKPKPQWRPWSATCEKPQVEALERFVQDPSSEVEALERFVQETSIEVEALECFAQDSSSEEDQHLIDATFIHVEALERFVQDASSEVDQHLIDVMFKKFHLAKQCDAIRRYLLLGQGDFVQALMDLVQKELEQEASNVSEISLNHLVRTAIASSNAKYDEDDILDRIRAKKEKAHGGAESGWDVFTLQYDIRGPLATLFTAKEMARYLRVFQLLWFLKRVEHALAQCWTLLNWYQIGGTRRLGK
eukprot:gene7206-317_t